MKNLSTPAMPLSGDAYQDFASYDGTKRTSYNPECQGFTKLEQACITLGIPETGDQELDALILKSERKRIAAMAMRGLASAHDSEGGWSHDAKCAANAAAQYADALLEELAK